MSLDLAKGSQRGSRIVWALDANVSKFHVEVHTWLKKKVWLELQWLQSAGYVNVFSSAVRRPSATLAGIPLQCSVKYAPLQRMPCLLRPHVLHARACVLASVTSACLRCVLHDVCSALIIKLVRVSSDVACCVPSTAGMPLPNLSWAGRGLAQWLSGLRWCRRP